jgi:phage I-like protein
MNAHAAGTDAATPVQRGTMQLANRFSPPKDGWIQLSPLGDFPHHSGVVQVVDAEALHSLANSLTGDLLLDFDHESSDPTKRTTAAGWIDALEARADGLWGHVRWSAAGDAALANGEYRFVSPVWDVEDLGSKRVRPVQLLEAGLTNKPNLKNLQPISNREHSAPGGEPGLGTTAEAATKEKLMKLINRALDLSPDASEEAAAAGIDKLKQDRAQASASLADAKTQLANRDAEITQLKSAITASDEAHADSLLDAAGIQEAAERGIFRSAILANREQGSALLKLTVTARKEAADLKAAATKPLTNRQEAKTPADTKTELTGLARTQAAFKADKEAK